MGMSICHNEGPWVELRALDGAEYLEQPNLGLALVTEHRQKHSFFFGDAEMVEINLPDIYIVYGDIALKKHRLRFRSTDAPDYVELHFSISGSGRLENFISGRSYRFSAQEHNIIYEPAFDGTGQFNESGGYKFLELHFRKEYFIKALSGNGEMIDRFCEHVAAGRFATLSEHNMAITLEIRQCVSDIINCNFKGGLKALFLNAKCLELLTLQARASQAFGRDRGQSVLKSRYDIDSIHHAKDLLLANADQPLSLQELARQVGINEFKLKNGFKELYQTTVFGYLSDVKLHKAKQQLLEGVPIKSVAEALGYSSVQHFSNAFRKKFGVSPGKSVALSGKLH